MERSLHQRGFTLIEPIATIGAEDTLIGVAGPVTGDNTTIRVVGSASGAAADASAPSYLSYRNRGSTTPQSASVLVRDARGAADSLVADVALTGDLRPGRASGSSDAPRDVFGRLVDCPDPS